MSVDRGRTAKRASAESPKMAVGDREYALAPLVESLGFLARVVHVQITGRCRADDRLTMSLASYSLLHLVDANPGIYQAHAARILLIQEPNMVSLVKALVEKGCIERRGSEGSTRGGFWITETGRKQLKAMSALEAINRAYTSVLSDREHKQLVDLLKRVYCAAL